MGGNFQIGANNTGTCTLHIGRHIYGRAFQFHTQVTMFHLVRYTPSFTTDMKWMVVEWAETLRYGAFHSPFPIKKLAQVIPCNFNLAMIHAMVAHSLCSKKHPTEISFLSQFNDHVLIILYILLFYWLNAIGILLQNILDMNTYKGFEDATTALCRKRFIPNSIISQIV